MSTNAADLIEHLAEKGKTLCTVESCTGGLVFSTLTAIAGASAVLDRGFITYSNQAKQDMVGVAPETLIQFGAVSQQTAAEMAKGGQRTAGTDLSVSLTGIAGPGGGTQDKPVGLIWISACTNDGRQITERYQFSGDRQKIRQAACDAALNLLQKISAG